MKIFLSTLLFISYLSVNCQNCKDVNKELIVSTINRHIQFPNDVECDYTGIGVLKICKEDDSIKMTSVYYSCKAYDFSTQKSLSRSLNNYCKDSLPDKCTLIYPIVFYSRLNDTIQKPAENKLEAMNTQLRKINKGKNVIVLDESEFVLYNITTDHSLDPSIVPSNHINE